MSFDQNFENLEKDIKSGKKLVLIVGAGVNVSKGVKLLWKQIINPLLDVSLKQFAIREGIEGEDVYALLELFGITTTNILKSKASEEDISELTELSEAIVGEYTPQTKALLVKSILGDSYIASFQEKIYGECNRRTLQEAFFTDYSLIPDSDDKKEKKHRFYTLYTTARMILLNPNIHAVVTYNYDNFLRHAINILQENAEVFFTEEERAVIANRFHKCEDLKSDDPLLKVVDIYNETPDVYCDDTIFIYHPHGYIPSPDETDNLDDAYIVMSIDEYCDSASRAYSWDNEIQVHLMSHYTSIFIGCSFSELSTQRMVHYASQNGNKHHLYNLTAVNSTDCDSVAERLRINLRKLRNCYLSSFGLTNVISTDGYYGLFKQINRITSEYCKILNERRL